MDRKSVEDAYLADVRLWIANNLERLGLNAHQLSKRTGVSAMTISRLMDEAKSTSRQSPLSTHWKKPSIRRPHSMVGPSTILIRTTPSRSQI